MIVVLKLVNAVTALPNEEVLRRTTGGLIPGRAGDFCFLHRIQPGSGAHPSSQGKYPGPDADCISHYSAGVRNGWSCPPLPHASSWYGT